MRFVREAALHVLPLVFPKTLKSFCVFEVNIEYLIELKAANDFMNFSFVTHQPKLLNLNVKWCFELW